MTKKSIKHASTDVGFIFIAYNLERITNIIGSVKMLIYLVLSVFSAKNTVK